METMTLATLRAIMTAHGSAFWSARTSDYDIEDDTHLAAWAWIDWPGDVELAGATVQVRHGQYTRGEWVEVRA